MAAERTDEDIDLLLQNQTPRLGQRLIGIAGRVSR